MFCLITRLNEWKCHLQFNSQFNSQHESLSFSNLHFTGNFSLSPFSWLASHLLLLHVSVSLTIEEAMEAIFLPSLRLVTSCNKISQQPLYFLSLLSSSPSSSASLISHHSFPHSLVKPIPSITLSVSKSVCV